VNKGSGPIRHWVLERHWWVIFATAGLILASTPVGARTCKDAASFRDVNVALAEIEGSVDPCGQSDEVLRVVREFRRCATGRYRICLDLNSERNFIDPGTQTTGSTTTITWNPELRSELEHGCGHHAGRPVLRDPNASLLHELVHAVQDCRGLDPTEHEFEAVRIENIYRRAQGLCQRTRYGEDPLPPPMIVACAPGDCSCGFTERPLDTAGARTESAIGSAASEAAGDVADLR